MASLTIIIFIPISVGSFDVFDQLFQAEVARLTKSDYHTHEKYYVWDPATDIEDLLIDLNQCNQLIVIHHHEEGKVNPARHSDLLRFGSNKCQFNSEVYVVNDKNTY